VLEEVTMREIEAIFAVTDRLGISREALAIPLMPRTPGRVRRMPNGRIEIVADAADFASFVARLEEALRAAAIV
jgi:acylphosphatase